METDRVCHAFLADANFYQLLFQIDQSIAEEVREHGCECGGVLHAAPYPRKPRGIRSALEDARYESRLSFCCAQDGCRRRSTPPSVRFLGRKVYLGVIVVLLTALNHGLSEARRRRRLIEELDVPLQTLWRWRRWWREQFVATRCWRAVAGQFIPPIDADTLPCALLERLSSGSSLSERLVQLLVLICPVTTSSSFLRVSGNPQNM